MVCPSCNTHNRDDAKFCKKCGYPFHPAAPESAPASASQAPATVSASESSVSVADDISLAPTQILTPEQMMAIQRRRWERELEEQQAQQQPGAALVNGDMKASSPASAHSQAEQTGAELPAHQSNPDTSDIADMPTVLMNPAQNEAAPPVPPAPSIPNDQPVPPPPPHAISGQEENSAEQTTTPATTEPSESISGQQPQQAQGNEATETSENQEKQQMPETPSAQVTASNESQEPAQDNASDPSSSNSDFAVLPVGTFVGGRYEVTEVMSEEAQGHIYAVIDHQGYQHCWNCGTEENSEGDEFCNDCGAELLNIPYVMHEYPGNGEQGAEASVLEGTIVNTFVDAGKTYAIEQEQVEQNAFPNGVHLAAATASDAGDVRRSDPNEDSTLILHMQRIHESISVPVGVFIVADGMGGHDNGQLASRVAINIIAERMVRELLDAPLALEKSGQSVQPADEETLVSLLQGAVEDANATICQVNQREKTDMGSTITGFMVVGEHAYILNVGDSRTYMVRGGQIYQLTNDHSLVGQLVAGGLIQPDDVYTHPQRNQIFRSLGDKLNVQVDIFKQQLHPGDILLSCCDGLWEMIRNPQIESILNTAVGPQAACTQLVETANTNGGEDNISVVVVYVS